MQLGLRLLRMCALIMVAIAASIRLLMGLSNTILLAWYLK